MILLIDNYDSFSYNLYQYIGTINTDIKVIRNDEMTTKEIEELKPTHIIISPGPGKPSDAGICKDVIEYFKGKIPILGVCLGHQAICEQFGAVVSHSNKLMHGKQSESFVDNKTKLFKDMAEKIVVGRYHSLEAKQEGLPASLEVIAETSDNEIMAVKHKDFEIYGVQFHPESILTPDGMKILTNFFEEVK